MEKVSVAPIPRPASQTVSAESSQKVEEQEYAAVAGSVHGYNATFSDGRGFDLTRVPAWQGGVMREGGLIVEDALTELREGQMSKSQFLGQLRAGIIQAIEPVLARVGQTTEGCPYLNYWLDLYHHKDAEHVERAVRKYAPDSVHARTAEQYIDVVIERALRAAEIWALTGKLSGIPEGAPVMLPGSEALGNALIAHELAHVGGSEALEQDADRTAVGVLSGLWSGVKGMARRTLPTLRSGLRLQRCGPSSSREVRTAPVAPAAPDPCPTSVELESVQDMTPGGLAMGYRTGYGIVSVMHLLPDSVDWSRAQVFERVSQASSSCPDAWQMCNPAGVPIPINQPRHSTVLGELPARRNRFYDFHTTRWNGSRLHDSTQNPTGMNECTVVCNQSYVCGERVLGNFRITRHFSKDVRNGREITVVNTTKEAVP